MANKWIAVGAAVLAAGLAAPAIAGRGIQIDVGASMAPTCALNDVNCTNSLSLLSQKFDSGPLSQVYIYREGVISFGAPIASSAAVFQVAQSGTVYDAYAGYTVIPGDVPESDFRVDLISFYIKDTVVEAGITAPEFQYSLYNADGLGSLQLGYAHLTAPSGATIGYRVNGQGQSVTNANGLRLGEADSASTFVFYLSQQDDMVSLDGKIFDPKFDGAPPPPAMPEPSTWAMLLIGFGSVGTLMRRRREEFVTA